MWNDDVVTGGPHGNRTHPHRASSSFVASIDLADRHQWSSSIEGPFLATVSRMLAVCYAWKLMRHDRKLDGSRGNLMAEAGAKAIADPNILHFGCLSTEFREPTHANASLVPEVLTNVLIRCHPNGPVLPAGRRFLDSSNRQCNVQRDLESTRWTHGTFAPVYSPSAIQRPVLLTNEALISIEQLAACHTIKWIEA